MLSPPSTQYSHPSTRDLMLFWVMTHEDPDHLDGEILDGSIHRGSHPQTP